MYFLGVSINKFNWTFVAPTLLTISDMYIIYSHLCWSPTFRDNEHCVVICLVTSNTSCCYNRNTKMYDVSSIAHINQSQEKIKVKTKVWGFFWLELIILGICVLMPIIFMNSFMERCVDIFVLLNKV